MKSYRLIAAVAALALLCGRGENRAAAGTAPPQSAAQPTGEAAPHGDNVLKLYKSRQLAQARKALLELVRREVRAAHENKGKRPIDLKVKLGLGVTVNLVGHCFDLDRQASGYPFHLPPELAEAVHQVRDALTAVIDEVKQVEAAQGIPDRVRRVMQFELRLLAELVVKVIVALKHMKEDKRAGALADRYRGFLKAQGVDVDKYLKIHVDWKDPRPR